MHRHAVLLLAALALAAAAALAPYAAEPRLAERLRAAAAAHPDPAVAAATR